MLCVCIIWLFCFSFFLLFVFLSPVLGPLSMCFLCMTGLTDPSSTALSIDSARKPTKEVSLRAVEGLLLLMLHWVGDRTVAITHGMQDV